MNRSKWEINRGEDFDTVSENTTVYQSWQENCIKTREIVFELCMLKRKKEMCPGCMRTLGILQFSTLLYKPHKYH